IPAIRTHISLSKASSQLEASEDSSTVSSSSKGKPRTSWIWKYGAKINSKPDTHDRCSCNLCPRSNVKEIYQCKPLSHPKTQRELSLHLTSIPGDSGNRIKRKMS